MIIFLRILTIFFIFNISQVAYAATSIEIDGYLVEARGEWQTQLVRNKNTEHMEVYFHTKYPEQKK